jgi:phospholipid/cholesterol/gamma-HCH transport system ATP-binding protein
MKGEDIIRVKDLVVTYDEDRILDKVSFDVKKGEIFIIVGGSGSGKTTLMRHMIGLQKPASGHIYIKNTDICTADEKTFFKVLRQIGVLFQASALIGSMTIAENIALPVFEFSGLPAPAVADIVRMKLSLVGLECYGDHLPSEISGGMKKRAGLARALALNPDILFLDEPSAGLDPVTAAEIDRLILHINQSIGTTVIIVTHDLDSIFTVGQRAIMLGRDTGRIIAQGPPVLLRDQNSDPEVRRFFTRQPREDDREKDLSGKVADGLAQSDI